MELNRLKKVREEEEKARINKEREVEGCKVIIE